MHSKLSLSNNPDDTRPSAAVKGLLLAAVFGLLCLMFPASGVAHSGGLDKIGCHHDRRNGGYHCHRGPLAGQAFASKEEALKALEKKQQDEEESKKAAANSKKDQASPEKLQGGIR
jgi:hypothetical protein